MVVLDRVVYREGVLVGCVIRCVIGCVIGCIDRAVYRERGCVVPDQE